MDGIQYKIYLFGIGDAYNPSYIYIPINPEELHLTFNGRTETVDIIGLGEALMVKNRALQRISWSSFFPASKELMEVVTGINDYVPYPDRTCHEIKFRISQMLPVTLMIIKTDDNGVMAPQVNQQFYIENFTQKDKGGEVGDIYYDISLVEYSKPVIVNNTPARVIQTSKTEAKVETVEEKKQVVKPEYEEGEIVIIDGPARFIYDATGAISTRTYDMAERIGQILSIDESKDEYTIWLQLQTQQKMMDSEFKMAGQYVEKMVKQFADDDGRKVFGWTVKANGLKEYYYLIKKIICPKKSIMRRAQGIERPF